MSTDATRAFLAERAPHLHVVEPDVTTATVADAAAALGVAPGQIAKTLAVRAGDRTFLLVAAGDARLDNAKFRSAFGSKPRMLDAEDTERLTGQPVGGVGPLGHAEPLELHLDESLRAHHTVYPAAGSRSSAFAVSPAELATLTGADWVDVTRRPE